MQTKKLGSQGLKIPLIGLGCMGMTKLGGADIYGKADEKESIATIHRSLELGGNFLDTADLYGPHLNEQLIARAISGNRQQYIIATKFGYEIDDQGQMTWRLNASPEYIRKSIDRSLKNLNTEVIDLYYLHRPDPKVPIEETIGAMAELVQAGKIKYIGVSEIDADLIRRAHAVAPITAVQNEVSLFSRDVETNGVWNTVNELGIGLIAYSPLGRGFLTGELTSPEGMAEDDFRRNIPRFQGAQFYRNIELVKELEKMAGEKGYTTSQLAIAWLLQKGITPIPGTKRRKYVEQNIAATNIQFTAGELQKIDAILPADAETGNRNFNFPE